MNVILCFRATDDLRTNCSVLFTFGQTKVATNKSLKIKYNCNSPSFTVGGVGSETPAVSEILRSRDSMFYTVYIMNLRFLNPSPTHVMFLTIF